MDVIFAAAIFILFSCVENVILNQTSIVSDDGLAPNQRQAII